MPVFDLSEYLLQHIDRCAAEPLNRQLYYRMREAILRRVLESNVRLPSTRELATALGMSRNTVLYAYEQLFAEGFIETRAGTGTYVAHTMPDSCDGAPGHANPVHPEPARLSRRGQSLVQHARASKQQWGAFTPGVPDVQQFPFKTWHAILRRVWRMPHHSMLTYAPGGGYDPLRRAVAEYLGLARSVNCDASQVVITSGIHQSIDLILRLLSDPLDSAWIEDPCYWGTRNLLIASGLEIEAVPVDEEGICLHKVAGAKAPKLVFVTPSHQYPLGPVMSLVRRRTLLDYANHHGCWVVEDDYDSEFRYEGRPLASLQGLDANNRVIYTGTFSKTMFPGLRLGYLVLPKALVASFVTGMEELHRSGQVPLQAAVAEFMEQGHFRRHVRRMRQMYATRLHGLQNAIARRFAGRNVDAAGGGAGLHLTLMLPLGTDDIAIARDANLQGIWVRALSQYYFSAETARPGLVLGYACVNEAQIDAAFNRLADIIETHLPHPS